MPLPHEKPDAPLPAPPPGWLTAEQAAELLGRSKRTVQAQCQRGRLAARQCETPAGPAWFIDPACRPAFRIARGEPVVVALAGDPLAGISAGKRAATHERLTIVHAYRAALAHRPAAMSVTEFQREWVAARRLTHPRGRKLGARTLRRWIRQLDADGLAGLVDRRRYHGEATVDPEAMAYFEGLYLRDSGQKIPRLYELVAAEAAGQGWAWPSLRTVQRYVAEVLDPKLRLAGREPRTYRDRCRPHIRRDWTQVPAMGCWVADHMIFDVLIPRLVDVKAARGRKATRKVWRWHRPWLTMYLDARSWMPIAWRVEFADPDGDRTMATFVDGVLAHGKPEAVYLDNGKDFRMYRYSGGRKRPARKGDRVVAEKSVRPILEMLGVEAVFARPYNPEAKVVEPFFRLVHEWFDKAWESYCGRSPAHRPEHVKAMHGRAQEYHAAGLTIESFAAAFGEWLTGDYALRPSPAKAAGGMSAAQAFTELRREDFAATRPPVETLMLLLMPSRPARVEAEGVWVAPFLDHYTHRDLEDRRCGSGRDLARKVTYRYIPDDPSAIWVFDARSDRYICKATPYVGGRMNPLVKAGSPDADRLGEAIALQRTLDKRYTRQVAERCQAADNRLLAASRAAGVAGGAIDESARPAAQPAARLQLTPNLDGPAIEIAAHRRRRREPEPSPKERLRQFLGAAEDPDQPAPRPRRRRALDLVVQSEEPGHEQRNTPPTDTT